MAVMQRLKELLDQAGVAYQVATHPTAYTAQEVAQAQHVPGRELVKVVVIRTSAGFALLALPATHRVALSRVHAFLSDPQARLATEQEFRDLFPQCEIGAMPPFGNLFGLPLYVDESLARDENIVFNAGSHTETVRMRYQDFVRVAQPVICSFAERA